MHIANWAMLKQTVSNAAIIFHHAQELSALNCFNQFAVSLSIWFLDNWSEADKSCRSSNEAIRKLRSAQRVTTELCVYEQNSMTTSTDLQLLHVVYMHSYMRLVRGDDDSVYRVAALPMDMRKFR